MERIDQIDIPYFGQRKAASQWPYSTTQLRGAHSRHGMPHSPHVLCSYAPPSCEVPLALTPAEGSS